MAKKKYREKESKELRLELANIKKNLHMWRSKEGENRREKIGRKKKSKNLPKMKN